MTADEIKEINSLCPEDQGIFTQPSMIPIHIKEPVIYCRYSTGGRRGGSCWGGKPYYETKAIPATDLGYLT